MMQHHTDTPQNTTSSNNEAGTEQLSVLLVDDDSTLASLWQKYLQGIGYRVDCCSRIADAEVLIHSNHYQLLIVDIFFREEGRLVTEGGVTLISRLRMQDGFTQNNPHGIAVLAVTGAPERSGGKFNAVASIKRLADGILHKPVRLEELGDEVRRLCAGDS